MQEISQKYRERRAKNIYNHCLSRKGYVGLEDELVCTQIFICMYNFPFQSITLIKKVMYDFNSFKFIYSNKLLETIKILVALPYGKQHTKIRKVDT